MIEILSICTNKINIENTILASVYQAWSAYVLEELPGDTKGFRVYKDANKEIYLDFYYKLLGNSPTAEYWQVSFIVDTFTDEYYNIIKDIQDNFLKGYQ